MRESTPLTSFKVTLWALLLIFLSVPLRAAGPDNVASLEDARARKLLSPFLGNYLQGGLQGDNTMALVTFENGRLQYWYSSGGIPSNSFDLKYAWLGQKRTQERQTSNGKAIVESEHTIDGNTAKTLEIITARFWKSVEERSLTRQGEELTFHIKRTYYKKKFGVAGEWVEDTTSFDGRNNTLDLTHTLLRISRQPMPLEAFFEYIQSQPTVYIRLKNPVPADEVRETLDNGDYEVVDDEMLAKELQSLIRRERGAEVIDLSEYRKGNRVSVPASRYAAPKHCDDLLTDGDEDDWPDHF